MTCCPSYWRSRRKRRRQSVCKLLLIRLTLMRNVKQIYGRALSRNDDGIFMSSQNDIKGTGGAIWDRTEDNRNGMTEKTLKKTIVMVVGAIVLNQNNVLPNGCRKKSTGNKSIGKWNLQNDDVEGRVGGKKDRYTTMRLLNLRVALYRERRIGVGEVMDYSFHTSYSIGRQYMVSYWTHVFLTCIGRFSRFERSGLWINWIHAYEVLLVLEWNQMPELWTCRRRRL